MNALYEELFKTPVQFRILEKRTKLLENWISELGLPELLSVAYKPLRHCERKRCFVNVEKTVKSSGGKALTGWIFNEFENRAIEAEAHCIWITPTNKKWDITPHEFQPKRVLFTPDPRVATNRGYTAAPNLVLSNDSRLKAVYAFESIIDKIREERFSGFGKALIISQEEITNAAANSNLPLDVAVYLVDKLQEAGDKAWAQYGSS